MSGMPSNQGPILIVMKPGDVRDVFVNELEEAGFEVLSANSAKDCIRLVRETPPSLIVMDQCLPDGDAWELIRILKSLAITRTAPVIGLTANDSRLNVQRAFIVGCDAFLAKPCDAAVLLEQVRELLETRRPA